MKAYILFSGLEQLHHLSLSQPNSFLFKSYFHRDVRIRLIQYYLASAFNRILLLHILHGLSNIFRCKVTSFLRSGSQFREKSLHINDS